MRGLEMHKIFWRVRDWKVGIKGWRGAWRRGIYIKCGLKQFFALCPILFYFIKGVPKDTFILL